MVACCAALSTVVLAAPALAHNRAEHRGSLGHQPFGHRGSPAHDGQGSSGRRSSSPTLFASPAGSSGTCTRQAPCSLPNAIAAAGRHATVIATPGTYDGGVVIDKPITLVGRQAVIDASGSSTGNGIQITGPGGSGSTVEGFKIENAEFEGILIGTAPVLTTSTSGQPATGGSPVTDVRILDNAVVDNDDGFGTTAGQCFSTPNAPGDCGEALHLVSVTDSVIQGNYVADNAGGILLTDEFGPNDGNVIRGNQSIDNTTDCGITLGGHGTAVDPATLQPTGAAGVFDNQVVDNIAIGDGVAGQGAGILLGGGAPFAGVYDNVIRGNFASGNGLPGITLHQHFAGDLNGNVMVDNTLINDNVAGDANFTTLDSDTTGILVGSGLPPGVPAGTVPSPGTITGTVIAHNRFLDDDTGIWTLGVDPATTTIAHNHFGAGVTTPVSTN